MTISLPPTYIPVDVCGTVGLAVSTDPDQCMQLVKEQIDQGAVSAPAADAAGLREVVQQAGRDGIDLKIVVLPSNPPIDTALRDVATAVGKSHPHSTVLVLSPSYVGTYSGQFTRAKLEVGEDHAKTGTPVQKAEHFLVEVNTPVFPWTAFTIVLLIGVIAATIGARLLQQRARRSANPDTTVATAALPD